MHKIAGRILLASILAAAGGLAVAQDQAVFQPHCTTVQADGANGALTALCDTGPLNAGRVSRVVFQKDATAQPAAEATFLAFGNSGKAAAVLVVVDRSDRRRARTVSLAAGDAVRLIEATRALASSDRFGLAALQGDRLDVVAPIGSNREDVAKAATSIRADATAADGVPGVLEAIRLLGQSPADRHVLVLASDGKAEDRSYARQDVIRAAADAGIAVLTIGYRERTGDGTEFGALRRFAEETGGYFAEPPLPSSRLDDPTVTRAAQFMVSGGTVTFPLDPAEPAGRYVINIETDGGKVLAGSFQAAVGAPVGNKPLRAAPTAQTVAAPAPPPPPPVKAAPGPQTTPGPQIGLTPPQSPQAQQPVAAAAPEPAPPGVIDRSTAFVVAQWAARPAVVGAVIAGAAIILLSLVGLLIHRVRRVKVYAWIEMMDSRHTRLPVTSGGVRLGRHSDNDIRFEDKSVHRYHAVLSRDAASGSYMISDVSRDNARSNGILINGELVHDKATLATGDVVELGDVRFRFVYA